MTSCAGAKTQEAPPPDSGVYVGAEGWSPLDAVTSADAVEGTFGALIQYYSPETFARNSRTVKADFTLRVVPEHAAGPPRALGTLMQLAPVSPQVLEGQFHDPSVRGKTWMYGHGETRSYGGFEISSTRVNRNGQDWLVLTLHVYDCDPGDWMLEDYATQKVYFLTVEK